MKIFRWNYLVVIYYVVQLQDATSVNCIELVTKKTLDGLKIYQTVIFTNNDINNYTKEEDQLVSEFSRKVPIVMINLRKLKISRGNRAHNLLKTINSNLFVIFSRNANKKIQDNLKITSKILPAAPRPKCLLIIFAEKKSWQLNDDVQKFLLYAWKLKYLDFTVIKKDLSNQIKMVRFNPFLNYYHMESFNQKSVVHPEKLKNIHHFRLNVPLTDFPPISYIEGNIKEGFKPGSGSLLNNYHKHVITFHI